MGDAVASLKAALALLADQLTRERTRAEAAEAKADIAATRADGLRDEIMVTEAKLAGEEGALAQARAYVEQETARAGRVEASKGCRPGTGGASDARRRGNGPGRGLRRPRTMPKRCGRLRTSGGAGDVWRASGTRGGANDRLDRAGAAGRGCECDPVVRGSHSTQLRRCAGPHQPGDIRRGHVRSRTLAATSGLRGVLARLRDALRAT
jgi:hypothetical protein